MKTKLVAEELVKIAKMIRKVAEKNTLEQYIDKKYPQKELNSIARAYADSLDIEDNVDGRGWDDLRNLHFKGEYVDASTFIKQAEIIGIHNEFDVGIAKKLVELMSRLVGSMVKYRLAREYSVAVYIKSPKNSSVDLSELENKLKADESSLEDSKEIRLWWD